MTQKALFINYEFCTGCHSCELACRNENKIPLGDFGIKLLENRPRQHENGSWH